MTTATDKALTIILEKFEAGRRKNPRFSQRSFAQRLELSSGALSEILQGKRPLTAKLKQKIAGKLDLTPSEKSEFFADSSEEGYIKQDRIKYTQLTNDQFHLISDWWHYAILNLLKTKTFKASPNWISERLGIAPKIALEAWDRLFRLGHIKKLNGKIVREFPRLETSDDIINLSVRRAHLEDLQLMENSLHEVPIELRDHTSMTVVINKKDLPRAKELIRLFQDRFSEEIETFPGDEVYRISISLFPLTKIQEKT